MRPMPGGRPGRPAALTAAMAVIAALGLTSGCSGTAPAAGSAATAPPGTSARPATGGVTRGGTWGHAAQIPGLARLNAGGHADVNAVSCSSAGNCLAGGAYSGSDNRSHAFVATERNGRWHAAVQVPGLVGPNAAGHATVNGHAAVYPVSCGTGGTCLVSCPSPGNCAVGGAYSDRQHNTQQAVVASVRHGRWQPAVDVLSSGGLDTGGNAWVTALSCASAGNCVAGGSYRDAQGHYQVFVVSQQGGRWQAATELPGIAQLNAAGLPQADSISCPVAGNCAAGGWYLDSSGNRHAFVASERSGRWLAAIEVPGGPAHAAVNVMSCGSQGNCAAGGSYTEGPGRLQGFVTSERDGRWRAAADVPGPHLNVGEEGGGGHASVDSVSCSRAGYCVAGGYYTDYDGHEQAFVAANR